MSIYDLIAADPAIQQAKYELEAIDEQISLVNRLTVQTVEDKVRKDALIMKWVQVKSKYDRAIQAILNGEVA